MVIPFDGARNDNTKIFQADRHARRKRVPQACRFAPFPLTSVFERKPNHERRYRR
jgi:hypothetical protein